MELLFSCLRQREGWDSNPSAAQFRYAYRAILIHAEVRGSRASNVPADLEGDVLLRHEGNISREREREETGLQVTDTAGSTEEGYAEVASLLCEEGYALSSFSSEVLMYIGGVHCEESVLKGDVPRVH